MLNFNIHYLNSDVPKLEAFNGNWIDLRCIELKVTRAETGEVETYTGNWETVTYEKGDVLFVNFGFSLDMTDTVTGEDYVANIYPRSSLFKNFGLILTNHVGCIDNSYKGTTDYWRGMLVAMRSGEVSKYDRLCQFEIKKPQPKITLHEVDDLGNVARNGYGTSGKQ